MFSSMAISLTLCALLSIGDCALQAYTGTTPTSNVSPLFTVQLIQGSKTLKPHVYYSRVNNNYLPSYTRNAFKDRSISWIEFGQGTSDTTTVKVTVKNGDGLFNNNNYPVRILPLSYGISVTVSNSYKTATFKIKGQFKHLSLEYGKNNEGESNSVKSSFKHSMLIFVGGLSPSVNKNDPNVLYFGPGVHDITSRGSNTILYTSKKTIYFARGSWVKGKININGGSGTNIIGYGVLDGSAFNYLKRNNNALDGAYSIVSSNYKPIHILGLTVFNPPSLAVGTLPSSSTVKGYRMIGWYYNQDGMGLAGSSKITDSFFRTNDDAVKISYAGSSSITVERIVIWQSFNGGCFQLGWNGKGCKNCRISNSDIIHAEWEGWNSNNNGQPNNAVVDMHQHETSSYTNLVVNNIRVDTKVGRIVGLGFEKGNGKLNGITLSNFNVRKPLKWFISSNKPQQFIATKSGGSSINNVKFINIKINGKKITSNAAWNLKKSGSVSGISYQSAAGYTEGDGEESTPLYWTEIFAIIICSVCCLFAGILGCGLYYYRRRKNRENRGKSIVENDGDNEDQDGDITKTGAYDMSPAVEPNGTSSGEEQDIEVEVTAIVEEQED